MNSIQFLCDLKLSFYGKVEKTHSGGHKLDKKEGRFTLTSPPSRPIYGHQSKFFRLYHKRDVGEHKKTQWNSYYLGLYLMIKSHKIGVFHRSGFPLVNLCQ